MLEKTFDPKVAEPRLYTAWEASGAFSPDAALARDPDARPFCMVIPPPNVTGSLHIGHALNVTLQDALARYHRMRGAAVLWLPGTDHAGIATQMMVERQLAAEGNMGRRELGRDAFVERVWAWKAQSGGAISNQLRRLGASCDWGRERFTLDDGLSRAVRKVFVDLYDKGLIYRAKRLVNWHPELQTALSDLEVEAIEVRGKMWHFAYPLDGEPIDGVSEIVIATTRPETMLGDGAVAVHPDDPRYTKFVGRMVRLPIAERLIPVIADEYPDPEKGSGAVKITGAHDFNDFEVAVRHGLPLFSIMDARARMAGPVPERYQGVDRYAARKMVIDEIEAMGLLREVEDRVIAQPHDEKSKSVVIEPYLTDQWYVDAKALAGPAIAAVEDGRTVFEPKAWEKTYFDWMRNIEPWCISRQLWWGHRIPVWYGPRKPQDWTDYEREHYQFDESAADTVVLYDPRIPKIFVGENAAELDKHAKVYYGSKIAINFSAQNWQSRFTASGPHAHKLNISGTSLGTADLYQDQDVLDTWFSSALWPFSTLGWPDETADLKRFYPTDTLVTGFDIIFFWVARMMMMGLHEMGEVPFRRVVINGLVRDERGQKMSKTRGNVIDPLEVVDELGADALRFSMAALSGTRDIKLSKSRIEGYRNFGTKLWNAARFCQMNECVSDPAFDPAAARQTVNRWMLGETVKAAQAVTAAFEAAEIDAAAQALYRFVWNVFCDWYLELAKPILNGGDEAAKTETRAMAAWTLDQALTLLHPISPFITEDLWGAAEEFGLRRESLLIETPWPDLPETWIDPEAQAEIGWLIDVLEEIRSVRSDLEISNSARPSLDISSVNWKRAEYLAFQYGDQLKLMGKLSSVSVSVYEERVPEGALQMVFRTGDIGTLSLAGFVDLASTKARLEKAIAVARGEADRTRKKLDNADFVARAPEAVVEETREKLGEAEAALAKLEAARARLETVG